jgi:serine/threonine-protein kinase HipA
VPTILFQPRDQLALRFVRTHDFESVNLHRFERVASFLQVDRKWVVREVKATIERALETWPAAAPNLLGEKWAATLLARLDRLKLVREVRS